MCQTYSPSQQWLSSSDQIVVVVKAHPWAKLQPAREDRYQVHSTILQVAGNRRSKTMPQLCKIADPRCARATESSQIVHGLRLRHLPGCRQSHCLCHPCELQCNVWSTFLQIGALHRQEGVVQDQQGGSLRKSSNAQKS